MNRLKELRIEQKLKQSELADKLGITQRKYSYIETNKSSMSVEMLEKISEYYQVNIDYLLCRTDEWEMLPKPSLTKEL